MNDHTKLSVNINKVATLRNARGGNVPNVLQVALDCERFGAEGITVHPAVIGTFKDAGIRTSIFIETDNKQIAAAKATGTDRIELYTESYAVDYAKDSAAAVSPYVNSAVFAKSIGLGVNAGHDLSLENLSFFAQKLYGTLDEVSIGHALIADSLYLGLHNAIQHYRNCLNPTAWK